LDLGLAIFLAVLFIASLAVICFLLSINVFNPDGKGAYRKTRRILGKFAMLRGFRVLTNVSIDYKGKSYPIENMLIGYFGILLVHTLGGRGEYYGQIDGKTWQRTLKEKKTTFPNPVLEQAEAMTALRALFSQNKVFNIPIENIVYMTNRAKKTGLFITNDNKIFLPGKLRAYLDKTKFEKDVGIDVGKLTEIIEKNRVQG
jgi:hypothetical protein